MHYDDFTYFASTNWRYKGSTISGLDIFEHKESGTINIYDPVTGDIVED